jgi:hypothetical protein
LTWSFRRFRGICRNLRGADILDDIHEAVKTFSKIALDGSGTLPLKDVIRDFSIAIVVKVYVY